MTSVTIAGDVLTAPIAVHVRTAARVRTARIASIAMGWRGKKGRVISLFSAHTGVVTSAEAEGKNGVLRRRNLVVDAARRRAVIKQLKFFV